MGCDYYIIIYLIVKYTGGGEEVEEYIEYDKRDMYYSCLYDTDVHDYEDFAKQERIDALQIYRQYNKILYETPNWLIKESAVQSYINTLLSRGISMDSVLRIEKRHECIER
jgi:hypothetical protein